MQIADRELVARVARDDPASREALEQLYRRHAPWVTARLQHRCSDPDLVDLAVQDTFVAVWRKAGDYAGHGEPAAWIWGIAIRKLLDQARRRRPIPVADPLNERGAPAALVSFEEELLGGGAYGPLVQALRSVEPDLVRVLVATVVDGLTTKETAALLGIPHGTVKTRAARARARLQELLR